MSALKSSSFFAKTRARVAKRVRALRQERRWSQAQLAAQLEISQSRLSEIERGDGSLTAEQLLYILKVFNETPASFVDEGSDRGLALQNALVRLGATHLHENDSVPAKRFDDPAEIIVETLLDGSPRLVSSLAPVLLKHAEQLNLRRLSNDLAEAGLPERLPWLIENTLDALAQIRARGRDLPHWSAIHRASAPLRLFLEYARDRRSTATDVPDVLDAAIRTKKTADAVQRTGSTISSRWNVISALQPTDFEESIRRSLGPR